MLMAFTDNAFKNSEQLIKKNKIKYYIVILAR